ncbi:MAG: nitrate ABC transporter ATP-binding protein [Chloroflexi bacterium]|nr:nitrate ABC transporter ATP-binding protein [Chloroflexota bacterium]
MIEIKNINFNFINQKILSDINLTVSSGEFISIIGPSGCGKSTLLNIISGITKPKTGEITVEGKKIAVGDKISYMQQKDLLLPWRNVRENAGIGLEIKGLPHTIIQKKISHLAKDFGLEKFLNYMPHELSGGLRQRVAFLRAVLIDNPIMLLDEPLGSLDAITKSSLHEWLMDVFRKFSKTIILVTHDIEEAILLANRVIVMSTNPGRILKEYIVDRNLVDNKDVTSNYFIKLKKEIIKDLIL